MVCVCVRACMHACVRAYMYVYMRVCVHVCVYRVVLHLFFRTTAHLFISVQVKDTHKWSPCYCNIMALILKLVHRCANPSESCC